MTDFKVIRMDKNALVALVQRAQHKDSQALEELFSQYYNDVYYFALKTLKDSDLACDITQETFLEVVKTIDKLKEPAAFEKWIRMVTYHQCTRYFKKKKDVLVTEDEDGNTLFDELVDDDENVVPQQEYENEEFQSTIMGMIDELSEQQRSAVMLYYFDELSISEIAQIQGVSEGTVKSRLNYARKSIKKSVESYEEKHNVKLHGIPFLPLFKLGFGATESLTGANLLAVKTAVAQAASSAGAGVSSAVAYTVSSASTTTKTTGGIIAKIAALPLFTKVVAIVIAVAIISGLVVLPFVTNDNEVENAVPVESSKYYDSTDNDDMDGFEKEDDRTDFEKLSLVISDDSLDDTGSRFVGIKKDGTVVATGSNEYGECEVSDWTDIVKVRAGETFIAGLKSDGTVVASGVFYDEEMSSDDYNGYSWEQTDGVNWTDIVDIAAGYGNLVGLKADGTVVMVGDGYYAEQDVSQWSNITKIVADSYHTVGLKSDGTVVATGQVVSIKGDENSYTFEQDWKNCEGSNWTDIVDVAVYDIGCTAGLKSDGTVVFLGSDAGYGYQYKDSPFDDYVNELVQLTDISQISVSNTGDVYGLKSDGTVIFVSNSLKSDSEVAQWTDVDCVKAFVNGVVGLKKDGTMLISGTPDVNQCCGCCTPVYVDANGKVEVDDDFEIK